ncbi:MAG: glycogen debranching protein GlgX [Kiritimatiellae bacterium]|nr:glycogen debranching protein GlgX [Kiritimatiellia bacterium]
MSRTRTERAVKENSHLLPSVPMPIPYGAHPVEDGVQFTLFSRHATRVWLMLFDAPDAETPSEEFELNAEKHRIGDIWHIHIKTARVGMYYLYRLEGRAPPGMKSFYNPEQWILDPYAQAISRPPAWGSSDGLVKGRHPERGSWFPKGIIVRDEFDWADDRTLKIPLSETVIYEAHLHGFTAHSSSGVSHPGTYRGFHDKIPYLQRLGVTAVEFLPLQEFNEMEYFHENSKRKDLRNYWGYSTLAFFAPNGRYAAGGVYGQQLKEFKKLVLALHRAGIEVILDVVFNHTAEGGNGGPTYSFRGIDNCVYYIMDEMGRNYANYTGCGNTVNSNHPVVRDFIMHCLRYWHLHMHVDGFRFDLASILARGRDGELLPEPPIVEHISEDPALRDCKIIAEAWDAAGAYQVGSFPSERFSEWNGRYRDDIRKFWRGDSGALGALATRLTGSADLYDRDSQSPLKSINFVTCHDGFTLRDLVMYEQKHNDANGEDNRDGESNNHSRNYGVEGETDNKAINAVRFRQQKNLLATLFLSQGVPMLLAGDEFSRTQKGNNNAYCQDNDISWVDWNLLRENNDLVEFVRQLIRFRKSQRTLRRTRFLTGQPFKGGADIAWYGRDGRAPEWHHDQTLACLLNGYREATGGHTDADSLFIIFNASENEATFHLPPAPGRAWQFEWTTQESQPAWNRPDARVTIQARSVTVFSSPS